MQKTCHGWTGHLPSRDNFSERLYEKKLTRLPKPTAFSHAQILQNIAFANLDCLPSTESTRLLASHSVYTKFARLGKRPF